MTNLFTISQAAKSCGVSRSTLIRLEERGILKPAFCSESNGYRYYDNHNITLILQIKMLLSMGLSYNDIGNYYNSKGTSTDIIKVLRQKLSLLERCLEEINLRFDYKNNLNCSIIHLPEYVCYAREFTGKNTNDKYVQMYNLFHEFIEKGYQPLATEPLFVINKRNDYLEGKYSDYEHSFVCAIPLEPKKAPKEAVVFPSCKALSVLYYGSYENVGTAYIELGNKVKEMNLTPVGFPRALGIVAPYTGREINSNNFVTRLALPIKE